jgi:uncharacterized protein YjbJ (UPF0337 family)
MRALKLNASWEEVKEKLKETDINLSDEDLQYNEGNEDQLLEHLSQKLKKTPDEVRGLIESVSSNNRMAG